MRFLTVLNGIKTLIKATQTRTGIEDANKIVATNSNGFIDESLIRPLPFTPENITNKVTNLSSADHTKYPTTLAVATALALIDQALNNINSLLSTKQNNLGFTPENIANKSTNLTNPDNTKYPTTLAVSSALSNYLLISQQVTSHAQLNDIGTNTHSTIDTHLSNTNNPHNLTKSQIGLGNVINIDTTTTANITDSLNKRFLTDSQQTILGNTSGINTGDETTNSIKTKLGSASTSIDGYLTSTNFTVFNNKQNALGFTPFNILGDTLTGTAGAGFVGFNSQSTKPSTPVSGFKIYADSSNKFSWIGQNGYVRTFDGTSNTADRNYTLPNNSGTIALTSDIPSVSINTNQIAFGTGTNIIGGSSSFVYDDTNKNIRITTNGIAGSSERGFVVTHHNDGVQAAVSQFCKSRGTYTSPTNVNIGDLVGLFAFRPRIGGSYPVDQSLFGAFMTSTTGISQGFITGSSPGNYVPNLLIHHTGNIGIGNFGNIISNTIVAPSSQLHIINSNTSQSGLILVGANNQSVDILQVLNSSNIKQLYIDSAYKLWGIDAEFSGEIKGTIYPLWDTFIYASSPTINLSSNNRNYWLNFSTNQNLILPTNSTITKNIQFNLYFRSTSTGTLTISSSATIQGTTTFSSGTVYLLFDTINNTWLIRP